MNATLWGGALFVGLLAAAWRQARDLAARAVGLLVVTVRVSNEELPCVAPVLAELRSRSRRTPPGDRTYFGLRRYVGPLGVNRGVFYEHVGAKPELFWVGRWPALVSCDGLPADSSARLTLRFLRGTLDPDALLEDAAESARLAAARDPGSGPRNRFTVFEHTGRPAWDAAPAGRPRSGPDTEVDASPRRRWPGDSAWTSEAFAAVRPVGWAESDLHPSPPTPGGVSLERLALGPAALALAAACRDWLAAEKWYRDRDVPWRLGALLHGPPGNGKTDFVRRLAYDLDLPVHAFDLASLDNARFTDAWNVCVQGAPCVALFEDLDAVFEGRKNVAREEGGLSFDRFLNALGGVRPAEGVLVFLTTNRPETLDPALADARDDAPSRPGRVDLVAHFAPPCLEGRRKIAARVLADDPALAAALAEAGEGQSGAQFLETCRSAALAALRTRPEEAR